MAQNPAELDSRKKNFKRYWKLLLPVGGVTVALASFAVLYLGYDLIKGETAPCESIFQQTAVGLSTKIKFLKAEGELKLGREKVAELSERAQMTALDLKTCCTVLDAGRIDPEQFLQCKAKAQTYDARVDDIAALVKAAMAENASAAPTAGPSTPALAQAVEAARTASQDFNRHVAKVSSDQALKTLTAAPAAKLAVDAAEREPNDDGLNANIVELDQQVKAAIGAANDGDVFTFTTPATHRDWIRVDVQNLSTTLDPKLELYDAAKALVGSTNNVTSGGDISYDFVAPPSTKFSVRIASYYVRNTGVYAVRIVPKKAYDALEPNDDILSARRIAEGAPVKAGIMDGSDADVFSIAGAPDGEREMTVTIANGSATLHPSLVVYDAGKTQIGNTQNTTAGGDLSFNFKAPKGPVYVRIGDYYRQSGGDYTLTIAPK
jgi:hypothetical protein